jgi:flagellar basal-body rod modification protein FlgD
MFVSPNAAGAQAAASGSNPSTPIVPAANKTLDQNDFLKLLTVQLSQQDPMKPMDDSQFMGQMAQFTSLQQTKEMSNSLSAMKSSTDLSSASSLIGRRVTVTSKSGDIVGNVTGVDASTGTAEIEIGGSLYDLSALKRIDPASVNDPSAVADPVAVQ